MIRTLTAPRRVGARLLQRTSVRLLAATALLCAAPAPTSGQVSPPTQPPTLGGGGLAPQGSAFLNVKDFGAVGDGVADDTRAFRRAIASAQSGVGNVSDGDTVLIPKGDYRIRGTLTIEAVSGLRLVGAGPLATRLFWAPTSDPGSVFVDSPPSKPLFRMHGAQDSVLENFAILVGSESLLPCAIHVDASSSLGSDSRVNVFRNLYIDGGLRGVERGVRITGDESNPLNEGHRFEGVRVENYLDAAFSLEQRGARRVLFQGCTFEGNGRGLTGVATNRGECTLTGGGTNCSGSFSWFGGGGGGNRGSDFELGELQDTILISGGSFRSSARFLHSGGPSGNQWPVIVQSVYWLDDMLGQYPDSPWGPNERMRIVNFQFRGPLVMTGNTFGDKQYELFGSNLGKPSEIIWNPGNSVGQFLFTGNYVASTKDNPFLGLTSGGTSLGIYPTVQEGNLMEPDLPGSNPAPMPIHPTPVSGGASKFSASWLHTSRELFRLYQGSPIDEIEHGTLGQRITLVALGARTIVTGPNLQLAGSTNFAMQAGDTLSLVQVDSGVWAETARSQL